jgi:hypothetical protein
MSYTLRLRPVVAALLLAALARAEATTFDVSSEATLRTALTSAVSGDTINFKGNVTLATGDLPALQTNLTVAGNGFTLSGGNQYRGLFVYSGNVAISNLTIANTLARGGNGGLVGGGGGAGLGGGLFVASGANVTLNAVQFSANAAAGGSGSGQSGYAGGGGGGMGGNGGVGNGGGGGGLGSGAAGGPGSGNGNGPGASGIVLGAAAGGAGSTGGGAGGAAGGGGGGGFYYNTPCSGGGGGGGIGGTAGTGGTGGNGGFGGGGGGTWSLASGGSAHGGNGGFGGGGGGGYGQATGVGGSGGFGGGGGGSVFGPAGGQGGFGGGSGGNQLGGGGGAGMGGAVFVMQGGTLTFGGATSQSGGTVSGGGAGGGAAAGAAFGSGIFMQGSGSVGFSPGAGQTQNFADVIADQTGSGGTGASAGSSSLVKSGAGTLVLASANTYSGGTQVNGGTLQIAATSALGGGALGFGGGTLQVTTGSLTFAQAVTLNAGGGTVQVDPGVGLAFSQSVSGFGGLTKTGTGTLTLGAATAAYTGGTTVQAGRLAIGSSSLVTDQITVMGGATLQLSGMPIYDKLTVQNGGVLDTGSAVLYNSAPLALAGGKIIGTGFVNLGSMDARGTIATGFTNLGDLSLSGALTLSTTANSGNVWLNGNALAGSATLTNAGLVAGKGTVAMPLDNSGGTIRANGGGTLLLQHLLSNTGGGQLIVDAGSTLFLGGSLANAAIVTLNGGSLWGSIVNTGLVEGNGQINGAVTNKSGGTLRASGGAMLYLPGGASNAAGGTLAADAGSTLRLGAAVTNGGTIVLAGGRFEIVGAGLANGGRIEVGGSSSLAANATTSTGTVVVDAATLRVDGDFGNDGSTTIDRSTVQFFGAVANSGTLHATQSSVSFLGGFTNTGTYITDPNRSTFTDLVNNSPGAIVAAAGDLFAVAGDLRGDTVNHAVWNTASATLEFTANPNGQHQFELSGADLGRSPGANAANFAWGTLHLDAGQKLSLVDASANWSGGKGALYVGGLQIDGFSGGSVDSFVAAAIAGNGFDVYYDPTLAANAWLAGASYALGGGGSLVAISAVPEPGSVALWLLGLAALPLAARRRRG